MYSTKQRRKCSVLKLLEYQINPHSKLVQQLLISKKKTLKGQYAKTIKFFWAKASQGKKMMNILIFLPLQIYTVETVVICGIIFLVLGAF
jgi:hypothetical protein